MDSPLRRAIWDIKNTTFRGGKFDVAMQVLAKKETECAAQFFTEGVEELKKLVNDLDKIAEDGSRRNDQLMKAKEEELRFQKSVLKNLRDQLNASRAESMAKNDEIQMLREELNEKEEMEKREEELMKDWDDESGDIQLLSIHDT